MDGLLPCIIVILAFAFVRKITLAAKNNPGATKAVGRGVWFLGSRWFR